MKIFHILFLSLVLFNKWFKDWTQRNPAVFLNGERVTYKIILQKVLTKIKACHTSTIQPRCEEINHLSYKPKLKNLIVKFSSQKYITESETWNRL